MSQFPYEGTISHGTMRPEDLIPVFLSVLETLDSSSARQMTSGNDPLDEEVISYLTIDGWSGTIPDHLSEHASEMVNWLFDHLESAAPEGYYFGSHPGDGADYGFWPMEED